MASNLPPELQSQLQGGGGLAPGQGPVANPNQGQQKIFPQSAQGLHPDQQADISGMQQLEGLQTAPDDFRSQMHPSAQGDPVQEFFVEIMGMGDDHDLLDSIQAEPDVESQLDEASGVNDQLDPMAEIGQEQMQVLVQKFNAIPPERQHEVVDLFRQELPPEMFRKLEAVVRLMSGRETQVQATGV